MASETFYIFCSKCSHMHYKNISYSNIKQVVITAVLMAP